MSKASAHSTSTHTLSPRTDFKWVNGPEPHSQRRKDMLLKYPHIKNLYGYDILSPVKIVLSVLLQVVTCHFVCRYDLSWGVVVVLGWVWGGTINHSLMLAIHEFSHELVLPQPWMNVWGGIFASLPLGLPISLGFKKYHLIHHANQGIVNVDPDLPTIFEGNVFRNPVSKFLFLFFQPLIYAFRPLIMIPTNTSIMEVVAFVVQFIFDYAIMHYFGWKSFAYLLLSTLLGSGIHPLAAHFVAEHYLWDDRFETYSYYGPLNMLVYNVGYHNEHHDFPRIPGSRLPKLHKIAPEYYKDIGIHKSWPMVLYRFIFDSSITPFSRVLRKGKKLI